MEYLRESLGVQIHRCLHRVTARSLYTLPRIDIRLPISDHHLRRPSVGPDVTGCEPVSAVFEVVEVGTPSQRS
jgi:hypothetical protein